MDSTPLEPGPGRSLKAMWAAIGALAVAVAALGGMLLHQESRNQASAPATAVATAPPVQAPDDGQPGLVPAAPPPVVAQAPVRAATVIGAVGGGFAGNEVEKRYHTATVYEVGVRMQDGSLRTVETATAPPVGKAVTLKGKLLQPADGRK